MANELDKTIEELESEVLEELEEAEHGAMKLKPNATATDPMQKLKTNPEDGGMETIPGSTPDKVAPHGGAAASKSVKQVMILSLKKVERQTRWIKQKVNQMVHQHLTNHLQ